MSLRRFATGVLMAGLLAALPAGSISTQGGGAALAQSTATAPPPLDYEGWGRFATRAEEQLADPAIASDRLEGLRADLTGWREQFLSAQTANAPRIDSLTQQITALGDPPAEGASEPEELAKRRAELNEQLATAKAPGLAAEEAYRRADSLIREADTLLRSRDAATLMQRDPAPANPANWSNGFGALSAFADTMRTEVQRTFSSDYRWKAFKDALPLLALALVGVMVAWWMGRRAIDHLIHRLQDRLPREWWGIIEPPISVLQVALPVTAMVFLSQVLVTSGAFGRQTNLILGEGLVNAGIVLACFLWIGWHVLPKDDRLAHVVSLSPDERAEGRLHVLILGLALTFEALITPAFSVRSYGLGAQIITYPVTLVAGLLLFRLGQLLVRSAENDASQEGGSSFASTITQLLGRGAMVIGVVGPLLGAAGYINLADAMVRPAIGTLAVVGILVLVQRFLFDIYRLITKKPEEEADQALLPVLVSFMLALASLPLLALVWGMRSADLWEYWTRLREGFQIGETRISPTDFMVLLGVFGVGYAITRLLQTALKSTILPRTSLDTGGRNAIVAGTGYAGYVIAALAAISAAGLNMSSLAMLASALSVGIGFGLQNIVQNFVSGVILLIERPVAEGDWVEVGGVQGIVQRISIRSTRVETFDRTSVIVPNASLISSSVTNYTGFNMTGRLIMPISVGYDVDSRHVAAILQEIAESQPMVLLNPPPTVPLVSYGAGLLNFELRMILRDVNFSTTVKSEINHAILARFSAEGITLPATTREVRTFVQVSEEEITQALEAKAAKEAEA